MAYENKPNTGMLFKNKSDNDRAPVVKGFIILPDGKKLEIAGWANTDKNDEPYWSLKLSEPYNRQ